jgi:hypothetical protein
MSKPIHPRPDGIFAPIPDRRPSKPTARELLDKAKTEGLVRWEVGEILATRVEAVLALHRCTGPTDPDGDACVECGDPGPCSTRRILDGIDE